MKQLSLLQLLLPIILALHVNYIIARIKLPNEECKLGTIEFVCVDGWEGESKASILIELIGLLLCVQIPFGLFPRLISSLAFVCLSLARLSTMIYRAHEPGCPGTRTEKFKFAC